MAKRKGKIPAEQGKVGYGRPPAEHRFKPRKSGNPKGRPPSAGSTLIEWLNILAGKDFTEAQIRRIARDKRSPWTKRAAAERVLRTLEAGDLADFQPYLEGTKTLEDLRDDGLNTELVKKGKTTVRTDKDGTETQTREIELHDRSGADFDRIADRTEGKPTQRMEMEGTGVPLAVQIVTPMTKKAE